MYIIWIKTRARNQDISQSMTPLSSHQPDKATWPLLKRILDEFQLLSSGLGPTQYR